MPIGSNEVVVSKRALHYTFPVLLVAVTVLLTVSPSASAQVVPPLVLPNESEEIPPQYEDTIRDLVNRYEDLREQLRVQIRRNADMYTRAEMDAALSDLRRELDEAQARIGTLEALLKESIVRHRVAEEKSRRYKATLIKTEAGLLRELDTTMRIVDTMQVEKIFQAGPTFSPAGTLGALGIINLPGTPLSFVAGSDYDLRDQNWTYKFGVTFSFLSQRSIVDAWVRLRSRERQKELLTRQELDAIRARHR